MAKFKLTNMHKLILSAALARADGNLLPPPEGLGELSEGIRTALGQLVRHGCAAEIETTEPDSIWRTDGDKSFGLVITDKGRSAAADQAPPPAAKPAKKIETVLALLQREQGATLAELVDATGWLSHTMRAALTGLRKKGHVIDKAMRDGATCYVIAQAA
jgi:hypothetical protein